MLPLVSKAIGAPVCSAILTHPSVRTQLCRVPGLRRIYATGWHFRHPLDRRYGTDTSGVAHAPRIEGEPVFYAASQPSVIRQALQTLPDLEDCTFVDLGCGKGRALLVAAEFSFRDIYGVEFDNRLARVAQRNVSRVRRLRVARGAPQVFVGDARDFQFPAGNLVVYMYNPFGAVAVSEVIRRLEACASRPTSRIFVVYYNPVHAEHIDAFASFTRHFAGKLAYSSEERGYAPGTEDLVIIWRATPPLRATEPSAAEC